MPPVISPERIASVYAAALRATDGDQRQALHLLSATIRLYLIWLDGQRDERDGAHDGRKEPRKDDER